MKLKKLLALALAGVMAVSMLAGCKKGADDNDDGGAVTETGIVAAVNDALKDADIDFLTFTAGDNAQLESALKAAGEKATGDEVRAKLVEIVDDSQAVYYATIEDVLNPVLNNVDDDPETNVGVNVYKVDDNLTEEASVKELASSIVNTVSPLKENNVVSGTTAVGSVATRYEYTATVSMVQATALDGTTCYYAAIVITSTATAYTA